MDPINTMGYIYLHLFNLSPFSHWHKYLLAKIKQGSSSVPISNLIWISSSSLHNLSSESNWQGTVVWDNPRGKERCSGKNGQPGNALWVGRRKGSTMMGTWHILQSCQSWGSLRSAHSGSGREPGQDLAHPFHPVPSNPTLLAATSLLFGAMSLL